jgi:hypothetical protein
MAPQSRSWAPHPGLVAISWILAAASITWAIFTDDRPGQVLISVASVTLVLAGLFGTIARPRLAADADGITVRSLVGRRHWPWAAVNVRLARTRRLGREVTTVEIDADPDLVVLGRFDLGADPADVIDAIRELRV